MFGSKIFVFGVLLAGLCLVQGSRWWTKDVCDMDGCHIEYHAFRAEEIKAVVAANPNLSSELADCIDRFETDLAGNMYEGGIITDCLFETIPVAKSKRDLWNKMFFCMRAQHVLLKNTVMLNIEMVC
ncbi:hypothetical protein FOCC_FOCC013848 [Frankliniella occidentalis]|uniref:Uncharacterized protein LOC113202021 n=1 Tax=Frankliniella occidentalis TaxID=133901 RepID=A0A6J1RSF6_FRAOC|nr:uncharacterized protein LOC113202021 [Frankliniella occidentalis]KAE8740629.1 hypothetical protein FOCC_FOCC013848 [Frankliniella occidentalis]